MKLEAINIAKLGNEDTHGICLATVNLFKPEHTLLDTTANAALTQLEEKTSELGQQLNRQRANVLTKGINGLNKTTDSIWKEVKGTVKRAAKSLVNAEKAQAAAELEDFFKPYWDSENLSTHTQTANFIEMFAKYTANTEMQAKAVLLGVDEALTLLNTKNSEMATLWQQRNDIEGNITSTPSASNVRHEIATTYSRFGLAIENQYIFTPTSELALLLGKMNEIRMKYSSLISVRVAANKRKIPPTPPNGKV